MAWSMEEKRTVLDKSLLGGISLSLSTPPPPSLLLLLAALQQTLTPIMACWASSNRCPWAGHSCLAQLLFSRYLYSNIWALHWYQYSAATRPFFSVKIKGNTHFSHGSLTGTQRMIKTLSKLLHKHMTHLRNNVNICCSPIHVDSDKGKNSCRIFFIDLLLTCHFNAIT